MAAEKYKQKSGAADSATVKPQPKGGGNGSPPTASSGIADASGSLLYCLRKRVAAHLLFDVCLVADGCMFGCRYLYVWLPMLVCLVADVCCVPLSSLMINNLMFVVLPSEGRRFEGRR